MNKQNTASTDNNIELYYNTLFTPWKKEIENLTFVIAIWDVENKYKYRLNNRSEKTLCQYTIIYDKSKKDTPLNYPNNYYCTNSSELMTIVKHMIDNSELFGSIEYIE